MFGKNPKRAPKKTDGSVLDVENIFPTIQGEGPFVGYPSVFIRLGGCNLACDFCDTEFENFKEFSLLDIIEKTKELSLNQKGLRVRNLVVLTGGEPFRQSITLLCEELLKEGFGVQIETNGVFYQELPLQVDIVCSPKIGQSKYYIHPEIYSRANALKFIISKNSPLYSKLPEFAANFAGAVYLQPMDEYDENLNRQNLEYCLELCCETGYLISLQTHKIMGID